MGAQAVSQVPMSTLVKEEDAWKHHWEVRDVEVLHHWSPWHSILLHRRWNLCHRDWRPHLKHFLSILPWRRVRVPTSIHLILQLHRVHRASMFGPRHFHILLSRQIRSMWQHLRQLICLRRADHVLRVHQQSTCRHLQR